MKNTFAVLYLPQQISTEYEINNARQINDRTGKCRNHAKKQRRLLNQANPIKNEVSENAEIEPTKLGKNSFDHDKSQRQY